MRPLTEDQIRGSFVNCSRGTAKRATMPVGFGELGWDDLDFLGWYDPKIPAQAYLVAPLGGRLVGLVLRAGDSSTPRRGAGLCTLCHSARPAGDVLLFVAARAGAAGRAGNTVGTYVCADLRCSLYARGILKLLLPQGEKLPPQERAGLIRDRLGVFVERVLDEV